MDLTGLLALGFLWFLFNLLTRGRGTGPSRPQPRHPGTPPDGADATQREGSQLEAFFRELQRSLEQPSAGPQGRPVRLPLPSAEEVEERETLETEPRVVSLEGEVVRPPRRLVDHDDEAEGIVGARIAAAEARSGSLTRADHARFDQRIRQEPADATAVRGYTSEQLRNAVVWREILGPPIALRDDER